LVELEIAEGADHRVDLSGQERRREGEVDVDQLDLEGRPGRAFYPEEQGVPAYDELIFVANSEKLDDPRLPKFLDAIEAGTLYLLNHPQESLALFVDGRPELDDELNRRAWADTLPRFALRPAALDTARYQRFAAFLKDQGLIKSTPPVETYAVELKR
jgi:putative hydroxymethylpyrimidine transport system substrate-binding protein